MDRVRGRVREGDVPSPVRIVKLKLPPLYKVNGKLKKRSIATHKNGYRFSVKQILCLTCLLLDFLR
jgi:hypothetical protein